MPFLGIPTSKQDLSKSWANPIFGGASQAYGHVTNNQHAVQVGKNITNPNVNIQGATNPQPQVKGASTGPAPAPTTTRNANETQPDMGGAVVSGGGSGSTGPTVADRATAAFWADRVANLRSLLGVIPTQRDQGLTNIEDDFRRNASRNNEDKSRVMRDISIKRTDANTDKARSLSRVDTNVANRLESFKRLMGIGHSGNSAFGRDFVPTATAREGSAQRRDVFDTTGRNMRNLDLSETDANSQFRRNEDDLGIQRNDAIRAFLGGLDDYVSGLNGQASEAAYNEQASLGGGADQVRAAIAPFSQSNDQLVRSLTSLFEHYRNPQMTINPVNVSVPELETYTHDPLTASLSLDNPGVPIQDLPFLPMLRRRPDLMA